MSLRSPQQRPGLATVAGAASDRRRHPRSLLTAAADAGVRARLLGLLAVAGVLCVVAEIAVGSLRGAAAATVLALAVAVPAAATFVFSGTEASPASRRDGLGRVKAVLVLGMLVGVVAYVGGGGTFASFSAETTNAGSTVASGTLTLSDTVNSGTACLSQAGVANVKSDCAAVLTLGNVAPGVYGGTAKVTVENTGSIDAANLWLWAPATKTTLNGSITVGQSVSTIPVASLASPVVAGQEVRVGPPSTESFYASTNVAASPSAPTTIPVTTRAATSAHAGGVDVEAFDCYDAVSSTPGASGSTTGADLNFVTAAGNPLCKALLLYVQEITGTVDGTPGTKNYCWFGLGYADGSGMCYAPISVTLTAPLTTTPSGTTALPVAALNGNVKSGDKIVVTSGTTTQTFTASADRYVGATSIAVNAATATIAFPAGSTVTNPTTDNTGPLVMLDGDANSDHTLMNFGTQHDGPRGPIPLPRVQSNGQLYASTVPQLPHGTASKRTFLVGIMLPAPTGSNQNTLQGLFSTFGLTWHVDQ